MSGCSDLYNRQLHPDEKQKIHDHANGDAAEEKKLTEAACYRVQCWAQYSPNSNEWLQNYVSPQEAAGLTSELSWVDSQRVPGGQFDYTLGQRATDLGLSQWDQFSRGVQQFGQDVRNLPHDLANQQLRNPTASQGDANPLIDVTNGGNGTPPTPAVVTPSTTLMTPEGPVPVPSVVVPGSPGYVPSTATFNNGNNDDGAQGKVNVEPGATPDPNETRAGQGLANLGYDVTHQPTASSQGVDGVRTADLSISGVGQVDVYTPKSGTSLNAITRAIEAKADQANGVFVQADISQSDMASIASRTWGKPSAQSINTLFFQQPDGIIVRFDRPVGGK